jgi:hypothetical protein
MPDVAYGLKVKCQHCPWETQLNFGEAQCRITGGIEMLCPRCKKISIFLGVMGQNPHLNRAVQDAQGAAKEKPPESGA